MTAARDRLGDKLRRFADACEDRSPLYAHLARQAADDPEVAGLLALAPTDRLAHPTLLFAAVHDLVMRGCAPDLGRWYASVGGNRDLVDDPWPAFRATVLGQRAAIGRRIRTRRTQTNEVARCGALLLALAAVQRDVDRPLAWLDVGTSAGLTLRLPRFRQVLRHADGRVDEVGSTDAKVVLHCDLAGHPPLDAHPRLAWRRGLDAAPVDVTAVDDRTWLQACVWPEQTERLARLRAALEVAVDDPVTVEPGDAVDDLARVAAQAPPDLHLVISHTWVLAYLEPAQRDAFEVELAALGSRRDVDRVGMESGGLLPHTVTERVARSWLGRSSWRSGERRDTVLAQVDDHGRWVRWGPAR